MATPQQIQAKRLAGFKRARAQAQARRKAEQQAKKLGAGAEVKVILKEGKAVGFKAQKQVSLPRSKASVENIERLKAQGKTEQLPGQPLTKPEVEAREKVESQREERKEVAPVQQQQAQTFTDGGVRGVVTQVPERPRTREQIVPSLLDVANRLEFRAEFRSESPLERQVLSFGALGTSAVAGFLAPIVDPLGTAKGLARQVTNPVETMQDIQSQVQTAPIGFVGSLIGTSAGFGVIGKGLKRSPLKVKTETTRVPRVENVPVIESLTDTGVVFRQQPARVQTTTTIRSVGLQLSGRGKVLGSALTESGVTELRVGRPKPSAKIPLESLTKEVPAPVTDVGTKALTSTLELKPTEVKRIQAVQKAGRTFKGEKGLKVKDVVFELETLDKPRASSKVIEKFIAEEKGVVFGTATNQQLPKGFRVKPGDIDVVFPSLTVEQLTPRVKGLAEQLRLGGEQVQVSPKNPLIVESLKIPGEKVVETKSGINQEILGEAPAPVGGLGFEFANLKGGGVGRIVKFGEAKAITAGEQFVRKGVASSFFRGKDLSAPKPFQEAGVLPKGRRTKDISGFIASGRGIEAIKGKKFNPLEQFRARRGGRALTEFERSFTKEQRKFIQDELTSRGTEVKIPIESPSVSPSQFGRARLPSVVKLPTTQRNVVDLIRSRTPSRSPSPTTKSPSVSRLPKLPKSPSVSSVVSKSVSRVVSGTPSKSPVSKAPKSPSPSKVPKSKVPGSPSRIARSISRSLLVSKSPRPSRALRSFFASPSPTTKRRTFPTTKTPPGFRNPAVEQALGGRRRAERKTKFTPSLVALEERIFIKKKPKKLSGLEVRGIAI